MARATAGASDEALLAALTAAALAKAGVRAAATLVEINVSTGGADDDRLSRVDQLLATTAAAQEVVEGAETRSRR